MQREGYQYSTDRNGHYLCIDAYDTISSSSLLDEPRLISTDEEPPTDITFGNRYAHIQTSSDAEVNGFSTQTGTYSTQVDSLHLRVGSYTDTCPPLSPRSDTFTPYVGSYSSRTYTSRSDPNTVRTGTYTNTKGHTVAFDPSLTYPAETPKRPKIPNHYHIRDPFSPEGNPALHRLICMKLIQLQIALGDLLQEQNRAYIIRDRALKTKAGRKAPLIPTYDY